MSDINLQPFRVQAVTHAAKYIGTMESPPNSNRGTAIDRWNRNACGLVGVYWCCSFVHGMFDEVGLDLPGGASVYQVHEWAKSIGEIVQRPLKGDLVLYSWSEPYQHIGFVERVISFGPAIVLQTIEGNTGKDDQGSQDNGGGVFRRHRVVRRSQVEFIRVPGKPKLDLPPQTRYHLVYRNGIPYTEPVTPKKKIVKQTPKK